MDVLIPTPLRSYSGQSHVDIPGKTLEDVLAELDKRFPGIRFRMIDEQERMRPHMRFFVNGVQVRELSHPLLPTDAVQIVQALSGG
jgi:molybdopterin converting factor small subunit